MNPRRNRVFWKAAISALALWVAFHGVPAGDTLAVLKGAPKWGFVVAFGLYLGSQFLSALRWRRIVTSSGFTLRKAIAVRYYFIGMFFNLFGLSTVGGDLARILYLARDGGTVAASAATVFFDRFTGFVWLGVIASISLATVADYGLPPQLILFVYVVTLVAVGVWFFLPHAGRWGHVLPARLRAALATSAAAAWQNGRVRSVAAGFSVAIHLAQIGAAIALVQTFVPSCPPGYAFVFHPLVAMLSALPVSIAGLGIRETGYVYFLDNLQGVSRHDASAFALAWLLIVVAASCVGGVVFVLAGKALPRKHESRSS